MEDLIPIGQFGAASRLLPKALRLYDENGLLPPARVDPDTGYRFYRLSQELRAENVPAGADLVVYHGEVNEDADGPVEVALPTENGEHERPATEVAFTVAEGADTIFPAIIGAYDAVATWAKQNGRELDGPPLEINRCEEGQPPRLEIAWPIR